MKKGGCLAETTEHHGVGLSGRVLWTMSIACGVAVANIYYNQPMLAEMARTFHASVPEIGWVATATQLGYAVGMPLFVPLGELVERRRLVTLLFLAAALSSVAAAVAPGLAWIVVASFLVGATSVIAQVLIPLATEMDPRRQGLAIGRLLSGVLLGILLARTLSGIVARQIGWRMMFWIAAGFSLMMSATLMVVLPKIPPKPTMGYSQIMRSLLRLPSRAPALLAVGVRAGLFFAAFIAFWTTLVFYLETPPYHYGSQAAGLFGLVGAVGALVAPLAGRMADRRGPPFVARAAVIICLAAFAIFWLLGWHLWGLIAGVIVLDAGTQAAQVANQSDAFRQLPDARNRVNTVYMLCYFGGGTLGSLVGTWAWDTGRWMGVCLSGMVFLLLAGGILTIRTRPASSRLTVPEST